MEELAAKALPQGFGYEWTGTVYQQRKAKGHEAILFGLSGHPGFCCCWRRWAKAGPRRSPWS